MSGQHAGWRELLDDYSRFLLGSRTLLERVPRNVREAGWCGRPPATESQIQACEDRLGTKLPPSYREFLKFTNGWSLFDDFIPQLWSTEEVDWYHVLYPDRAEAEILDWERRGRPSIPDAEYFDYEHANTGAFREEYLPNCLVLGQGIDFELVLINPRIVGEGNEWEAWYLASWIPGARRYRSFRELCMRRIEVTKEISP